MNTEHAYLPSWLQLKLDIATVLIEKGDPLPLDLYADLVEAGIDVEGLIQQYADTLPR